MKKRRHSNVDRLRLHKKNHFSLAEKRRRSSSFASPFDAFSSINTLKCVSEHLFINCVLKINQENSENIIMDESGKLKEPPALSASRLLVPSNIMDNWNQHKTLFGDKIKILGNNFDNRQGFLKKFSLYLQVFYERSRLRYFIPIIILLAYSFLGGIIFYTIESPAERVALLEKEEYMNKEENKVLDVIMEIEDELKYFFIKAKNITVYYYYLHEYRKFAMNKLNQRIYWYALESYYLSDQEAFKSSLLHPTKPEPHWSGYFKKPYGQIYALKNYTEQLSLRCWEICAELTGKEKAKIKLKEALKLFHQWTGLEHILSPTFTFRNSMFLAVTTYTTIGYGNITPKTNKGRFAVMIYAIVGIPLVLMILHKLGRYILLALEYTWDMTIYAMEAVGGLKNGEKYKSKILDEERDSGIPVLVAMFVAFGWMFMCAAAFLFFEKDWDYFKSFYFFFCSLTTIGYGDVVPTSSDDMFIIFFFIIIGLSLVSMCINVVQLKLEQLVEEILLAMMEEYTGDLEFGFSGANLKARLGVVDMWKIWKRRRSRKKKEKVAKAKDIVVEDVKHGIEKKTSFVNKNFREMMPFGKRRRVDEIMQEIQKRLVQKNKAVQTDPVIIYRIDEKPFENKVCFANKSVGSSSLSLNKKPELGSIGENLDELPIKYKRDITYRHNQTEHEIRRRPVLPPSYGIQYPINEEGYQYNPTRRWTFVETGKAPKGAPRGLAAHYMYRDQQYPHSDELEYLVQEIDTRLKECRKKLLEKQKADALKNRRNTQTSETDE